MLHLLLVAAVLSPASSARAALEYVEGEVLVTFKDSMGRDAAEKVLQAHSLKWARHYDWLTQKRGKQTGLLRDKSKTTSALIAELSREPGVELAETNYIRRVSATLPNDPGFPKMWGLRNTGQSVEGTAGTPGADIHFPAAWALAQSPSNQVVVAVLDTGVDYTHPDLASNMWVNTAEIPGNGIDDDTNGYVDDIHGYDFADGVSSPQDSGFHGTHVAGTIAAIGNNQTGVIGVAYHAKIMALRVSSDGETITSSAEIEGLQYAALMKSRGVNIVAINASFGGGGYSDTESAAITAAGNAGIIFCAAAGNSSLDHDTTASYPASYRLTNMIVVAATDQNDNLASFSDYGPSTVDLGAPGVNIYSTAPTNYAVTVSSVQAGTNTFDAIGMTYAGTNAGLAGNFVYCGLGNPSDFTNNAVSNNIALIQRGTLTFATKVQNAMNAGARAAVIYNNASGNFSGTLGSTNNWIPAVSLSQADGLSLQALLPASGTVVNATGPYLYQYLSGTSMATPHVVGGVAFAAMNFPAESVTQRIQRVLSGVDQVAGLSAYVITGGRLNLQRIVDSDTNGLPDWWELQYFGNLTGTDPNGDADHDGASNLAEWLAGTDPTNAASNFHFGKISHSTNGFALQWQSAPGKSYRLLRATNLSAGFNAIVATNLAATPPTNSLTDTNILRNGPVYYRLELEQ